MVYFAKWKVWVIGIVLVAGVIFALPNLFSRETVEQWPSFLPRQQINLGLDLQGGSHMLLEVDVASVVREQLTSVVDSVRAALRKENIGYTDLGTAGNSVVLKLRDPTQIETARPTASSPTSSDRTTCTSSLMAARSPGSVPTTRVMSRA